MDTTPRRPSNVDRMLLAGRYRYTDFPGAEPVPVEVVYEHGTCIVCFPPRDGDDGAEIMFPDMGAYDDWPGHFERIDDGS